MGKGDQRTRKGKIRNGSYGKSRPHKQETKRKRPPPKRPTERPRR
jgi:ribosomal small subunit protein bTHX